MKIGRSIYETKKHLEVCEKKDDDSLLQRHPIYTLEEENCYNVGWAHYLSIALLVMLLNHCYYTNCIRPESFSTLFKTWMIWTNGITTNSESNQDHIPNCFISQPVRSMLSNVTSERGDYALHRTLWVRHYLLLLFIR